MSSSSNWGFISRDKTITSTGQPGASAPDNLTALLDEVRGKIPFIPGSSLKFDFYLGRGGSFEVNREVYNESENPDSKAFFVAVKHVKSQNAQANRSAVLYSSIRREIQVLTQANLEHVPNILGLLGYGMTECQDGVSLYLVTEYSENGTLSDFLKATHLRPQARRGLALDIATGLKALHDSGIIHGDIKLANTLVFPNARVQEDRKWTAKLADMGAAIFGNESHDSVYTGTILYNAPEQRDRHLKVKPCSAQRFYQADIWSFGLALAEIMDNGEKYLKSEWKAQDESDMEFLNRVHIHEHDGILKRVYYAELSLEQNSYVVEAAVQATLSLTLRDEPDARASMDEIVNSLSKRANIQESHIHPPPPLFVGREPAQVSPNDRLMPRNGNKLNAKALISSENFQWKGEDRATPEEAAKGALVLASRPIPARKAPWKPYHIDSLRWPSQGLPWSAKVQSARNLITNIDTIRNNPDYYSQCAKLAMYYHVGFGVKPDPKEMFRLLNMSAQGDNQARLVFQRLWTAIGSEEYAGDLDMRHGREMELEYLKASLDVTYFSTRFRMLQREDNQSRHSDIETQLDLTKLELAGNSNIASSNALYAACSTGHFDTAIALCSMCHTYQFDDELPTPLHWLVMFDERQLLELGRALASGPCRGLLDTAPTIGLGIFPFPQHCLELSGPPLHWAVRTRNLAMVCFLLDFGANINTRWRPATTQTQGEVEYVNTQRYKSSLDIAVQLHLPEIVNELLSRGAERVGGFRLQPRYSALSYFGFEHAPFIAYLMHGSQYREAASQTLRVMLEHGFNIQEVDSGGYDALMIALREAECQPYVIEELLKAGATADKKALNDNANAAIVVARSCFCHIYNTSSIALVAPIVNTINEVDRGGCNALHYFCAAGNYEAVNILIQQPEFDIHAESSIGKRALHFAAQFDRSELIEFLVRHGIPVDAQDHRHVTPLELAVSKRHLHSIDRLLDLGAKTIFVDSRSIIHAATANPQNRTGLVKYLLDTHRSLRSPKLLDHKALKYFPTALHEATNIGDCDSVEALLRYGADPNISVWGGNSPERPGKPIDFATSHLEKIDAGNEAIYKSHPFLRKLDADGLEDFKASLKTIKAMLSSSSV